MTTQPISVSISDAAKLIGIGRSQLYKAISNGDIRVRKLGRRTLIEMQEIQRFVDRLPQSTKD